MPKKKLLQVNFDPATRKRQVKETKNVKAGPADVFGSLSAFADLMPRVDFMEQWNTKSAGPKEARYHADYHEMVFIIDGQGSYIIEGKKYKVKKKDVVVIRPGEVHKNTDDSDFDCISLHFRLEKLQELKKKPGRKKGGMDDEFLKFLVNHYPKIHVLSLVEGSQVLNMARNLYREYASPGAGSSLMVSLEFLQIMVLIARNYLYAKKGSGLVNTQASARDEIMVRQIVKYIDQNFGRKINPTDLFKNYYMHPNHCRTIFKNIMGIPVTAYLLEKRMKEARVMVVDTELTLEEIANRVGLEDYFYFLRAFKKAHGVSPGALRRAPSH